MKKPSLNNQILIGAFMGVMLGLPIEALAILLPIDRPLDTIRSLVNVEGDMVGCIVVQKLA